MKPLLCGSKAVDGAARGVIIGFAWGAVFDTFAVTGSPRAASSAFLPSPYGTGTQTRAFPLAATAARCGRAIALAASSMGRSALGFSLFLGVYNGVNCNCEALRGKHDFINPLVSHCPTTFDNSYHRTDFALSPTAGWGHGCGRMCRSSHRVAAYGACLGNWHRSYHEHCRDLFWVSGWDRGKPGDGFSGTESNHYTWLNGSRVVISFIHRLADSSATGDKWL